MACKVLAVLIASLAFVSTSIIPPVKVLQGPGSRTSLYGPDGSASKSVAPGGTVVTDPDAPAGLVVAGPAILPASPEIIVGGGPAGKIVTSYTQAGPAMIPAVLPNEAVLAAPAAIATPAVNLLTALGSSTFFGPLYADGLHREEKY